MSKFFVTGNRYYARINGEKIPRAYLVWNKYHPENPVKPGEVIHHINENKLDDKIENLQKMTDSEHRRLHGKEIGARKLKEFREQHPEESHRYSSNAAKLLHQRMKLDPKFAEWVKAQRREGVIKFNKSRIGEKRSNEFKENHGKIMKKVWADPKMREMILEKRRICRERKRKGAI
jgi:hypothetical protein